MPVPFATPSDMNAQLLPGPVQGNSVRQKRGCCRSQMFDIIMLTICGFLLCIYIVSIIVAHIFSAKEDTVFDHMVDQIVENTPNKTIAEGVNELKDVDDTDFYLLETGGFTWFILLCALCMCCYTSHGSEMVERISVAFSYTDTEVACEDDEHQKELAANDDEHQKELAAKIAEHQKELAAKNAEHHKELAAKIAEHNDALARKDDEHQKKLAALNADILRKDIKIAELIQIQDKTSAAVNECDSSDSSDLSDSSDDEQPEAEPEPEPDTVLKSQSEGRFVM